MGCMIYGFVNMDQHEAYREITDWMRFQLWLALINHRILGYSMFRQVHLARCCMHVWVCEGIRTTQCSKLSPISLLGIIAGNRRKVGSACQVVKSFQKSVSQRQNRGSLGTFLSSCFNAPLGSVLRSRSSSCILAQSKCPFVSDPGHFYWQQNVLWKEDLPPDSLVALGLNKGKTRSEVKAYCEHMQFAGQI